MAFEELYAEDGSSLKKIATETTLAGLLPTDALTAESGMLHSSNHPEIERLIEGKLGGFSVAINLTSSWPRKLADSSKPTPVLYYKGILNLIEMRSVSIVGARKATAGGLARANKLAKALAEAGVAVVTGLARGIDTAAATAALTAGGTVIGVIGTPIDEYYPLENKNLQDRVASEGLLLSQVPFYKYSVQPFKTKRIYFPERNELMAAVSDATVIIEASDTSGTLSQARACIRQGRPLFIARSCVENKDVSWPERFVGKDGVFILDDVDAVLDAIG